MQNHVSLDGDESHDERLGYVPYLSHSKIRLQLERIIEDFGEDVLEREKLRYLNATVFFNLWWFCCRFSLPPPLAVLGEMPEASKDDAPVYNNHCCAFAAWEISVAIAALTLYKMAIIEQLHLSRTKEDHFGCGIVNLNVIL